MRGKLVMGSKATVNINYTPTIVGNRTPRITRVCRGRNTPTAVGKRQIGYYPPKPGWKHSRQRGKTASRYRKLYHALRFIAFKPRQLHELLLEMLAHGRIDVGDPADDVKVPPAVVHSCM